MNGKKRFYLAPAVQLILNLTSIVLLGVVDWWSGYELNFYVFYFAPIALAAWKLGLIPACLSAVFSGAVWCLADWYSGHRYSSDFYAYWNTALRTFSFLIIACATYRIRKLSDEAHRVAQRLGRLLPMCAWCKKIRNDTGYWEQVEHYLQEHSDARFTHSICEDCAKKQLKEETGADQPWAPADRSVDS